MSIWFAALLMALLGYVFTNLVVYSEICLLKLLQWIFLQATEQIILRNLFDDLHALILPCAWYLIKRGAVPLCEVTSNEIETDINTSGYQPEIATWYIYDFDFSFFSGGPLHNYHNDWGRFACSYRFFWILTNCELACCQFFVAT